MLLLLIGCLGCRHWWAMVKGHVPQVGSIFEFANRNAIFGVVKPDNFLWAPILLFFAITGLPSAGVVVCAGLHGADTMCCAVDQPALMLSAACLCRLPIPQGNQCS